MTGDTDPSSGVPRATTYLERGTRTRYRRCCGRPYDVYDGARGCQRCYPDNPPPFAPGELAAWAKVNPP